MNDLSHDTLAVDTTVENKASAIRRAYQVLRADTKPTEVVEYLKREENIDVTPSYVSVVKSQLVKKVNEQSFDALRYARKLIRETGSVQGARNAIEVVAEEQEKIMSIRGEYEKQIMEIDFRLNNENNPPRPKEKQDLVSDRKRIAKFLEASEEM